MPICPGYKNWCWWHDPEEGQTYTFCPQCAYWWEKNHPNLTWGAGNPVSYNYFPDEGEYVCDECGKQREEV